MTDKGEYRSIYVALIDSPEFQDLSACARACLHVLKLKLGPSGIAVFCSETLPRYTGFAAPGCESAIEELQHGGWLMVERNVFWLRNGLRFEPSDPLSSGNGRKGILKHLRTLPSLEIVKRFAADYQLDEAQPDPVPPPPEATPPEAPPNPLPSPFQAPSKQGGGKGKRETDIQTTSTTGVREGDLSRLREYLPDKPAVVDRVNGSAKHPPGWAAAVFALYGPRSGDELAMRGVAEPDRPRVLGLALERFAAEAQPYHAPFFRGILDRARTDFLRRDAAPFGIAPRASPRGAQRARDDQEYVGTTEWKGGFAP